MPGEISNGNYFNPAQLFTALGPCPECKLGACELVARENPVIEGLSLMCPVYEFVCRRCGFSTPWSPDVETAGIFWLAWKRGGMAWKGGDL